MEINGKNIREYSIKIDTKDLQELKKLLENIGQRCTDFSHNRRYNITYVSYCNINDSPMFHNGYSNYTIYDKGYTPDYRFDNHRLSRNNNIIDFEFFKNKLREYKLKRILN